MRLLYALREEMSAGSDPRGKKRESLEAGRGKMRGVWNLRGGLSEESDRAERVSEEAVCMEYIEWNKMQRKRFALHFVC